MIEIPLKAGESFPVQATARYFIVRSVGDGVFLSIRNSEDVQLQNSDVIDLISINELSIVNKSSSEQSIKFQHSPFKIEVGASKNSIKSIEEIVTVQMDKDVNIGAVAQEGEWLVKTDSAANINTHKSRVLCLKGQATKLCDAGQRKNIRLNIRADQFSGVSLGGDNTVNDNSGGYLDVGMVDYIDTKGALWAFNASDSDVLVDVLELV